MLNTAAAMMRSLDHCDWFLVGLGTTLVLLLIAGIRAIRKEARHRRAVLHLKTTAQQRALWRNHTQLPEFQNLLDDIDVLLNGQR